MSLRLRLGLKGLDKTVNAWRKLPQDLKARVYLKATGEAARYVQQEMILTAPAGVNYRLVNNYEIRKRTGRVFTGHAITLIARVFPEFYYAVAVEFGRKGWEEGSPWMRPSLYGSAPHVLRIFKKRLTRELKFYKVL